MGRVLGWIVGILILYAIISQPIQAAATTRELAASLATAGRQVIVFFQSVAAPTNHVSALGISVIGVEAGDGMDA